jgi:DNA-binding NtrC family response regulator
MKARHDRESLAGAGKVFLVDDEPSVRRALTRLLRAAGLEVASFPSAEALLAEASPSLGGPACVVADLQMPGLTASPSRTSWSGAASTCRSWSSPGTVTFPAPSAR